ncbi:MAG: hypothetical protein A2527_11435 [Candidatus Lambdaproteobacteria bacterium RIFOXYD2_FULL_50_16]|uniref:Uncharacterized protein n=1 Tax=Candidatus Lambdaproteobacteria bacterium RIFOXYD2_FULL_50_16 TaxID=1817772 RepID=A0A1F6G6K3_9PROT|nr:MAG: hypothetical protein A2527_11435 [Candidatus Lambdaproteobacteria bacterium RIFOXYD2_FULL_50_16]
MFLKIVESAPLLFGGTVILPVVAGLLSAYVGFKNLENSYETKQHQERVEDTQERHTAQNEEILRIQQEHRKEVQEFMDRLERNMTLFREYDNKLPLGDPKSPMIQAMISQYETMKNVLYQSSMGTTETIQLEHSQLALDLAQRLNRAIGSYVETMTSAGEMLTINFGGNKFLVLFKVPMRIPPRIEILDIPPSIKYELSHISTAGFEVVFQGPQKIEHFGFMASAEL